MKRVMVILAWLSVLTSLYAQSYTYELYASANLKLRELPSLQSSVITILPKYTTLHLISEGSSQTIDGISAKWINVETQNGYTGWCFSGYVCKKESYVADELATLFSNYKSGSFTGTETKHSKYPGISDLGFIKQKEGYYIQQQQRSFQGSGRAPEILKLFISNQNVYISEIDILNKQEIEKAKIQLAFDGITYSKGKTCLYQIGNDIAIRYLEHNPDHEWLGTWEYEELYSFVSEISNLKSDKVIKLTSDYLSQFAGDYVFDSIDVVTDSENSKINDLARKTILHVSYDIEKKCLTVPIHDLIDYYEPDNGVGNYTLSFVETSFDEPFFYAYGEGVGHSEERYFFYKGGIGLRYEMVGAVLGDELAVLRNKYQLFYVYFKKK